MALPWTNLRDLTEIFARFIWFGPEPFSACSTYFVINTNYKDTYTEIPLGTLPLASWNDANLTKLHSINTADTTHWENRVQ